MWKEWNGQVATPTRRLGESSSPKPVNWQQLLKRTVSALAALFVCGGVIWQSGNPAAAQGDSPTQLRQFIAQQVGGLDKLMMPAKNADLPQPRRADGSIDPQFKTTEAKRYLGKLLFHDPVRMVRIMPQFGGVPATRQSASCASCHLGEAASKAGTLLNFAAGGEGRGYTNAEGDFIPRRRPRLDLLPRLREMPLFPGDVMVDELPTLTDVYAIAGPASPARARKQPDPGALLRTGRLDALDSVARNAPGVLGAGFNNRLLLGGFAGEPDASPGGLNPFDFPAQESVALLLLDAHRMLDLQSAEIQKVPVFVRLFREAFPEEAAMADARDDLNILINDITVLRATASFMRTAVTRNTPWDRFLAGDNNALTVAQRRGARLFFTPATNGMGGAGCYTCHSGPILNKQVNDPDVAGMGTFVEENFFNIGLGDHPAQALNRQARGDDMLDDGRREITGRQNDIYKFRVVTLRQLRDARIFMHNGAFTSVRDVVQYFNAGVPQNEQSGGADTLSPRFTNPRGAGSPRGLGLTEQQVNDVTDFLENALDDPAFARYDPTSTTDSFNPNPRDLTYSVYRPDLAALGAIDGRMPSGLPMANNDPLSRRDMGLEFLDVTSQAGTARISSLSFGRRQEDVVTVTNNSQSVVDTHLIVIVRGITGQAQLANAGGVTRSGDPYLRVFLPSGVLMPGQSINVRLSFTRLNPLPVRYTFKLLSGQGNP